MAAVAGGAILLGVAMLLFRRSERRSAVALAPDRDHLDHLEPDRLARGTHSRGAGVLAVRGLGDVPAHTLGQLGAGMTETHFRTTSCIECDAVLLVSNVAVDAHYPNRPFFEVLCPSCGGPRIGVPGRSGPGGRPAEAHYAGRGVTER